MKSISLHHYIISKIYFISPYINMHIRYLDFIFLLKRCFCWQTDRQDKRGCLQWHNILYPYLKVTVQSVSKHAKLEWYGNQGHLNKHDSYREKRLLRNVRNYGTSYWKEIQNPSNHESEKGSKQIKSEVLNITIL